MELKDLDFFDCLDCVVTKSESDEEISILNKETGNGIKIPIKLFRVCDVNSLFNKVSKGYRQVKREYGI